MLKDTRPKKKKKRVHKIQYFYKILEKQNSSNVTADQYLLWKAMRGITKGHK